MDEHNAPLFEQLLQIQKKNLDKAQSDLERIKRPRKRIFVLDKSETEHADIAWGKNTLTGQWCASIYFEPPVIEDEGELDSDVAWKERSL